MDKALVGKMKNVKVLGVAVISKSLSCLCFLVTDCWHGYLVVRCMQYEQLKLGLYSQAKANSFSNLYLFLECSLFLWQQFLNI